MPTIGCRRWGGLWRRARQAGASTLPVIALALAGDASAECCQVAKVDPDTPPVQVRVCTPDADAECAALLYEGTLGLGASQQVCAPTPTIVYEEYDASAGEYLPMVEARCEAGDDIEL